MKKHPTLALVLAVIPALTALAVISFGPPVKVGRTSILLWVADINIGLLFLLAFTSIGVYGIILGGWSFNNKYSLLGGIRSSAQMISYELALGLSVVGILMIYGAIQLDEIVRGQGELIWGWIPKWGVVTQPLAFFLFLTATFAESNRLPFDLPEAESELVVGYHTEYSAMRFALFMMTEYMAMITGSMLIVTLFFGGWQIPWITSEALREMVGPIPAALLQVGAFTTKTLFFLWLFVWVRWTLPRFRYDQLMRLGWKGILPLALLNLFVTGAILYAIR